MMAQYCECTQYHWVIHFEMVKMVNIVLCTFHHNNKQIKKWLECCSNLDFGSQLKGLHSKIKVGNAKDLKSVVLSPTEWKKSRGEFSCDSLVLATAESN